MKKLLFALAGILLSLSINAQMNTGSFFAVGNSSFDLGFSTINNIDNNEKTTVLKYTLNPKAGYFIKNRLAIGGGVEFASIPYSSEFGNAARQSRLVFGPFARYYVQYGTLIPFAEASLGYGYQNDIQIYSDGTFKTEHSVFTNSIGVGTDFFLNEKIAIEAMMKYYYEKQKPTYDGATGGGHAISGIVAYFGIVIFFESI